MLSKSKVDRAGARLREWVQQIEQHGPVALTTEAEEAAQVIWSYRLQFQYPLTKVNANLRHYVAKTKSDVIIAQRLKRLPRIVEKLHRQPRMRLSQMQDVGGCRAILPTQDAIYQVLDGISKNWDIITVDDYVGRPKATGYRAVHAIVRKGDCPIEVQLRTIGQQDWADEVERIDGIASYSLKDGEGPPEVLRYMSLLADVISAAETGKAIDRSHILDEMANLRSHLP